MPENASKGHFSREKAIDIRVYARHSIGTYLPAKSLELRHTIKLIRELESEIFKTITADNGSKFANHSFLETKNVGIYFTHPYTSYEKGSVECHNRMLRRFIPKGKSIENYTAEEIIIFADIINGMPRKISGYLTFS